MSSRPKFAPVAGRTANLLADEETGAAALDRPIGRIMRDAKVISDQQLQTILSHQRNRGVRFGEAAIHLGLATHEDIAWALSQQFRYAFAPGAKQGHPELVMASNPFGAEGEIFRELRSQLLMGILAPDAPRSALAFVSPDVRDGRTYVAANIAVAFSQLGGRGTLLIDADLRSPRQLELFGIGSDVPGLSSILSGRAESRVIQPMADLPNLYVLPAGAPPPNPLELVQRAGFGLLVSDLLDKFDHVVVDTPAASRGADCRVIAGACGAAVVLARKGRSRMDSTGALLRGMAKGSSKIAGVVMNEY